MQGTQPNNATRVGPTGFPPTEIEVAIQYTFKNRRLLGQALTHGSASGLEEDALMGEKLSWLGDATLHLTVSDLLFRTYPDATKEELHKTRSKLTQNRTLAGIGSTLGIERSARLGPSLAGIGEARDQHKMVAGIVEALFGAVYLDSGPGEAQKVILHTLKKRFEHIQSYARRHPKKTVNQPIASEVR